MSSSIYEQAQAAISELCEKAKLKAGNIVVAGCSMRNVAMLPDRTTTRFIICVVAVVSSVLLFMQFGRWQRTRREQK